MNRYQQNAVLSSLRASLRFFLIGSALFLAGFMFNLFWTADTVSSPQERRADIESKVIPRAGDIHSTFTAVAARVRPAVVYIRTERSSSSGGDYDRFGPFDFFREMIPDDERHRRIPGGGSGFVIDNEGRILTNHHVIRDAQKINVVLGESPNEEEYEAEVVGFDVHTDIAVIKIKANRELPNVALGDSDEMMVGDWVMAIGTPFGQLSGTVTVGVVSAKGRTDLRIMGGEADYQNFIQTDASINFGNSGGPLVNLRGEAIGINTAINPSGQGIGFAIPINMAKNISAQLIEKGRVQYGFMGIRLRELDKDLAVGLGLDVDRGILVEEVLPDTPAEAAGLEAKDVIIEYQGEPVREASRFRLMVGNTPVGERVPVKIVRNGREKVVQMTLVERPQEEVLASAPPPREESWLGIQVDDVRSEEARSRFRIGSSQDGVVVIRVEENSPASTAGIAPGDVITEVYSKKVTSLEDYLEISNKLRDRKDPIAFLVKRGRTSTYVPVIPDKE